METNQIAFLSYLAKKLEINSEEFANFLFVDKRTLYNYKNYSIEKLPKKVKEKLLIFFQGFKEIFKENLTILDIYNALENSDSELISMLRQKFLDTARIRKSSLITTSTTNLLKKMENRRTVESLDEFLIDIEILLEYSTVSKAYLYTLFEIIISKIDLGNDYQLLDYINKYTKEEK